MRPLTQDILDAQKSSSVSCRVTVRINAWSPFGGVPYTWRTLSYKIPDAINEVNGAAATVCQLPAGAALRVFMPEDGSLRWQKISDPTDGQSWDTSTVHTHAAITGGAKIQRGNMVLLPTSNGATLIWQDNNVYRMNYTASSNTWSSGRITVTGNEDASPHLKGMQDSDGVFLLSGNRLMELSPGFSWRNAVELPDAIQRDEQNFRVAGIRKEDQELYCYLYHPNYDNPHGSDYWSILAELHYTRTSVGNFTLNRNQRGFHETRFIDQFGEGIGVWEYAENDPENPKSLTIERCTFGPGPNRPVFWALEEAGNSYSTVAEQDPTGKFLSDSEPKPDWPLPYGMGPEGTKEDLHPVRIHGNHYIAGATQVHVAVPNPTDREDEWETPINARITQSIPGADFQASSASAQILFQGDPQIRFGDKLTVRRKVSSYESAGGYKDLQLIVTDVSTPHPDTTVQAADPLTWIGLHLLRRPAIYNVPNTPVTEIFHHLIAKTGINVNTLTDEDQIIDAGFTIFPNDNPRSAIYRTNAVTSFLDYQADHEQDEPTIKIKDQRYSTDEPDYRYGPDDHPIANSAQTGSIMPDTTSIAAGSWDQTADQPKRAGSDPPDRYNSRKVFAIHSTQFGDGLPFRALTHTDTHHLFNEQRLQNTARENAHQLQRKNTDCYIHTRPNLGIEINDLVLVTDKHLGYEEKLLQVNGITESWDRNRMLQALSLYEPIDPPAYSLFDDKVSTRNQGVIAKGWTIPNDSGTNVVYAPEVQRRIPAVIDPDYVTGSQQAWIHDLSFYADGRMILTLTQDLDGNSHSSRSFTAAARAGMGIAIQLDTQRQFKWDARRLFPTDSSPPYQWAATAVTNAGTPNVEKLRNLIKASKHVVIVLVDITDDNIDWERLRLSTHRVEDRTGPTGGSPPDAITDLTATAGSQQVTLDWSDLEDNSITHFEYRTRPPAEE